MRSFSGGFRDVGVDVSGGLVTLAGRGIGCEAVIVKVVEVLSGIGNA